MESKVLQNFAIRKWGESYRDIEMNHKNFNEREILCYLDEQYENFRKLKSNSCFSVNLQKNHMHVILSPNYAHSAPNIDMEFPWLAIIQFYEIPRFFGQFSNSLTFPSYPYFLGNMATLQPRMNPEKAKVHMFNVSETIKGNRFQSCINTMGRMHEEIIAGKRKERSKRVLHTELNSFLTHSWC